MAKCDCEGGNCAKCKSQRQRSKEHRQHDELSSKRGESYGKAHGVHAPSYGHGDDRGASIAGDLSSRSTKLGSLGKQKRELAVDEHRRVLGEMKSDKGDRRNMADGGEVEEMDTDAMGPAGDDDAAIDDELMDMCAGELLEAFEKKDKKGILDAIRAIVLNSKE